MPMVERRQVIGGGLAAGLASLAAAAPLEAAAQRTGGGGTAGDMSAVATAIDQLRAVIQRQFDACELGPCAEVASIRQQQRVFMRATQKYPDFMEVGIDVWDSVYDWHLKHQQQVVSQRLPDGRYAMAFMFTNLLLRPDQAGNYVGYGFDGDQAPGRRP
jgi:hypothetical protein